MIHTECQTCRYCAWVDIIRECKEKIWICECIRPKFWGKEEENGQKCSYYKYCNWEKE